MDSVPMRAAFATLIIAHTLIFISQSYIHDAFYHSFVLKPAADTESIQNHGKAVHTEGMSDHAVCLYHGQGLKVPFFYEKKSSEKSGFSQYASLLFLSVMPFGISHLLPLSRSPPPFA